MTEVPLACNPFAFTDDQKRRYRELKASLLPRAEVHDLERGLALSLDAQAQTVLELAEFATLERLCCPFLTFNLELQPDQMGSRLSLTGPDGTASFLRHELGLS